MLTTDLITHLGGDPDEDDTAVDLDDLDDAESSEDEEDDEDYEETNGLDDEEL